MQVGPNIPFCRLFWGFHHKKTQTERNILYWNILYYSNDLCLFSLWSHFSFIDCILSNNFVIDCHLIFVFFCKLIVDIVSVFKFNMQLCFVVLLLLFMISIITLITEWNCTNPSSIIFWLFFWHLIVMTTKADSLPFSIFYPRIVKCSIFRFFSAILIADNCIMFLKSNCTENSCNFVSQTHLKHIILADMILESVLLQRKLWSMSKDWFFSFYQIIHCLSVFCFLSLLKWLLIILLPWWLASVIHIDGSVGARNLGPLCTLLLLLLLTFINLFCFLFPRSAFIIFEVLKVASSYFQKS